jgi:hypothetical protein
VLAPGPGHSRKDRSLSVKIDSHAPDGFLVHSFAGDDPIRCKDHVRSLIGLPGWDRKPRASQVRTDVSHETVDERRAWTEDELARIEAARRIWDEGVNPRGTLAERYLIEQRKLELTDELAGNVLRFHADCPWREESTGQTIKVPAMIAVFRSIHDDNITAVHRIRLNADGSKYGRRMLGVVHHSAVKLAPARKTLAIGEGVETAMAAQQLGLKPAWALGSAGAISFFPVLDGVAHLYLLAETGKASAQACKMCWPRWRRKGRKVQIITPNIGDDLNDAIIKNTGQTQ